MKLLIVALVILSASIAHAQAIVMTPGAGGQMYPAYVDPQYGLDGRALVPQDTRPRSTTIYEGVVPEGRSQRAWRIDTYGGQNYAFPVIVGDDDDD